MIFIMCTKFDGGWGRGGGPTLVARGGGPTLVALVALASTKCSTNLPQKLLTVSTPVFIFSLNIFP